MILYYRNFENIGYLLEDTTGATNPEENSDIESPHEINVKDDDTFIRMGCFLLGIDAHIVAEKEEELKEKCKDKEIETLYKVARGLNISVDGSIGVEASGKAEVILKQEDKKAVKKEEAELETVVDAVDSVTRDAETEASSEDEDVH